MTNVVVLVYTHEDSERFREFINDKSNGAYIVSIYQRSDWHIQKMAPPSGAYVVRVKDKKKEFQLRMQFETMPRLGVEF